MGGGCVQGAFNHGKLPKLRMGPSRRKYGRWFSGVRVSELGVASFPCDIEARASVRVPRDVEFVSAAEIGRDLQERRDSVTTRLGWNRVGGWHPALGQADQLDGTRSTTDELRRHASYVILGRHSPRSHDDHVSNVQLVHEFVDDAGAPDNACV